MNISENFYLFLEYEEENLYNIALTIESLYQKREYSAIGNMARRFLECLCYQICEKEMIIPISSEIENRPLFIKELLPLIKQAKKLNYWNIKTYVENIIDTGNEESHYNPQEGFNIPTKTEINSFLNSIYQIYLEYIRCYYNENIQFKKYSYPTKQENYEEKYFDISNNYGSLEKENINLNKEITNANNTISLLKIEKEELIKRIQDLENEIIINRTKLIDKYNNTNQANEIVENKLEIKKETTNSKNLNTDIYNLIKFMNEKKIYATKNTITKFLIGEKSFQSQCFNLDKEENFGKYDNSCIEEIAEIISLLEETNYILRDSCYLSINKERNFI